MTGFLYGVVATVAFIFFVCITFPIWWLLSGGDLDMHHWLLDGEGSILHRWKYRRFNGIDPWKERSR